MPLLATAIAYGQDFKSRDQWANRRKDSVAVGCPKGCPVEYDLIVSALATEDEIKKWIDVLHARMERVCPEHEDLIQF